MVDFLGIMGDPRIGNLSYTILSKIVFDENGNLKRLPYRIYRIANGKRMDTLNEYLLEEYKTDIDGVIINDTSYAETVISTGDVEVHNDYGNITINNVKLLHLSITSLKKSERDLLDRLRNTLVREMWDSRAYYRIENIFPSYDSELLRFEGNMVVYKPRGTLDARLDIRDIIHMIPGLFIP